MWIQLLWFLLGLACLVGGAELLVRGASRLALSIGISPLVVGLTVVAMGTSAPEIAVSVGAALDGKTDLALGNVVGSNIFNVLFILGASALIVPLAVHAQVIRQEVPLMLAVSGLLALLVFDGRLARGEAALLLALLVAYEVFLVVQSRRQTRATQEEYAQEFAATPARKDASWHQHWAVQLALIGAGLLLLILGSRWLVEASVAFARVLGVSDVVIGLTIVAAGTSMPEVAASLAAALKGERDIAVGNVVGSNIFNILGCLGLSGLVAAEGLTVPPVVLDFDLWVMLATAFACLPVFFTGREIARWEGAVFLGYYAAYTAYLILAAQQHAALEAFSRTMLLFVIPLTVVTLMASLLRARGANSR